MKIEPSRYVEKGTCIVVDMTKVFPDKPDQTIEVYCHPDDVERIRDVVAREEETPKWWRDRRQIEDLIQRSLGDD